MGSGRDKRKKAKNKVPGAGAVRTAQHTERNAIKQERREEKKAQVNVCKRQIDCNLSAVTPLLQLILPPYHGLSATADSRLRAYREARMTLMRWLHASSCRTLPALRFRLWSVCVPPRLACLLSSPLCPLARYKVSACWHILALPVHMQHAQL